MRYKVQVADSKQLANIEAALAIVDPQAELVVGENAADLDLIVTVSAEFKVRICIPQLGEAGNWEYQDLDIHDPRYDAADRGQRLKEIIRLGIIRVVGSCLGKTPPWGILSSVRPTKIFHYLRDKKFSVAEIKGILESIYGLSPAKADLLAEVGLSQEVFFKPANYVGIYVGIPFCPTRCHYCSFAAVSLETHRHEVAGFLKALRWEVEQIGALCRKHGFNIETIYVGGGTPTSLTESELAAVLQWLRETFYSESTREFTVEAGRPETITPAKVETMLRFGVNRISINPQTMHQHTLDLIGRAHTVGQVEAAVALVKPYPLTLNMDLILGLPGENGTDFATSLARVVGLDPDNVTIHTLAPKRAAAWRKSFDELELAKDRELQQANVAAERFLRKNGYGPYYLYRQRAILANLENIGFAKPGRESIYNIQMMEERQTIFGLGGGAVTKWVYGNDNRICRHQNPKCPATYSRRVELDVREKTLETQRLLG